MAFPRSQGPLQPRLHSQPPSADPAPQTCCPSDPHPPSQNPGVTASAPPPRQPRVIPISRPLVSVAGSLCHRAHRFWGEDTDSWGSPDPVCRTLCLFQVGGPAGPVRSGSETEGITPENTARQTVCTRSPGPPRGHDGAGDGPGAGPSSLVEEGGGQHSTRPSQGA